MQTTYGERLRKARELKGMSQAELARRLGLKPQAVQYLEEPRNMAQGSRHTARFADALGVDAVWLGSGFGDMRPAQKAGAAQARSPAPRSPSHLLKAIRSLRPELRDALGVIVDALHDNQPSKPTTYTFSEAQLRNETPTRALTKQKRAA